MPTFDEAYGAVERCLNKYISKKKGQWLPNWVVQAEIFKKEILEKKVKSKNNINELLLEVELFKESLYSECKRWTGYGDSELKVELEEVMRFIMSKDGVFIPDAEYVRLNTLEIQRLSTQNTPSSLQNCMSQESGSPPSAAWLNSEEVPPVIVNSPEKSTEEKREFDEFTGLSLSLELFEVTFPPEPPSPLSVRSFDGPIEVPDRQNQTRSIRKA